MKPIPQEFRQGPLPLFRPKGEIRALYPRCGLTLNIRRRVRVHSKQLRSLAGIARGEKAEWLPVSIADLPQVTVLEEIRCPGVLVPQMELESKEEVRCDCCGRKARR